MCENCTEISNFKQKLELVNVASISLENKNSVNDFSWFQATKDFEMRENAADRQIMDLHPELTSIRSKHSQLILKFEIAGNEQCTVAAANNALIEKQHSSRFRILSKKLKRLDIRHTTYITPKKNRNRILDLLINFRQ